MNDFPRIESVFAQILRSGTHSTPLHTCLLTSYSKCSNLETTLKVFRKLQESHNLDVKVWNTMISLCLKHQALEDAGRLFQSMQLMNVSHDDNTLLSMLKSCSQQRNLSLGRALHALIPLHKLQESVELQTAILTLYAKCSSISDFSAVATRMLQTPSHLDVVAWTLLIDSYNQLGYPSKAVQIFYTMLKAGKRPNAFTYTAVFSACAELRDLKTAKQMHDTLLQAQHYVTPHLSASLISMYGKCNSVEDARAVFNQHLTGEMVDVVVWNSMLQVYALHNQFDIAMELLEQLHNSVLSPNHITYR